MLRPCLSAASAPTCLLPPSPRASQAHLGHGRAQVPKALDFCYFCSIKRVFFTMYLTLQPDCHPLSL